MHRFQTLQTFREAEAALLAGISDLVVVDLPGGPVLVAVTRPGGGLITLRLGDAGMSLQSALSIAPGGFLPAPPELSIEVFAGVPTVMVSGGYVTRIGGYQLSALGDLGAAITLRGSPSGVFSAVDFAELNGVPMHFVAFAGESVIRSYALGPSARYAQVASTPFGAVGDMQDITVLRAERFHGAPHLIALSQESSEIALYRITDEGALALTGRIGVADGLALTGPVAAEIARMGDADFIIVAAAGASSIAVLQVLADGALRLADLVGDTLLTRFQSVQAIAVVQTAGWVFVVAGGGDDGLTLFALLPDGRLIKTGQIEQAVGLALDDVTALTARVATGGIEVLAAGEAVGISRLFVPLPELGPPLIGGAVAEALAGSAAQDLLFGAGGDDTLSGGGGDDILADGGGRDRLFGGGGADLFVLSRDGQTDRIEDFEPGRDRIDLTGWGRLYSTGELSIVSTPEGATIAWQDEIVEIRAQSAAPLAPMDLRAAILLDLWRIMPQPYLSDRTWFGTPYPDVIRGTASDEVFLATAGGDTIDGGRGTDTLDFAAAMSGVTVDLVFVLGHGGWATGLSITSIETLLGSDHDDSLRSSGLGERLSGRSGNDVLEGRGGNDTLEGGDGNDLLAGGSGADSLNGGDGLDLAVYWDAPEAIHLDLLLPERNTGIAAGDRLTAVENIWGTSFSDRLVADEGANVIYGHDGADTLEGRAGNDTLFGGAGNDTLIGGAGADLLVGGEGTDILAYWLEPAAIFVDMAVPGRTSGAAAGDQFSGIEAVFGTLFDDTLYGDDLGNFLAGGSGNDVLVGRAGADTLQGGAGNDTLEGGLGSDLLNGGPGLDIAVYWNAATGIGIDMVTTLGSLGESSGDVLAEVENIWGSAFDDRMAGDGLSNGLNGHLGNDLLFGRGGEDWLQGADGDDTLVGGGGADQLLGGAGRDTISYRDAPLGLRFDLVVSSLNTGDALGDVFSGIEDIEGSAHADTLVGDNLANTISGLGAGDVLQGREGNDSLFGGEGSDILIGGPGADRLYGGGGIDLAAYWDVATMIAVDLATGEAVSAGGTDILVDVEAVWGGTGNDLIRGDVQANHLTGDAGDDRLFGNAGNDSLFGGAGADLLDGEEGDDLLQGGEGSDRFVFRSGRDRLVDVNPLVDIIVIDRSVAAGLFQATDLSAFALIGADHITFDFSANTRLRLDGLTDLSVLLTAVELI